MDDGLKHMCDIIERPPQTEIEYLCAVAVFGDALCAWISVVAEVRDVLLLHLLS